MIHVSNYFMVRKPSFNFSDYSILSDEEFVNLTLKEQIKSHLCSFSRSIQILFEFR